VEAIIGAVGALVGGLITAGVTVWRDRRAPRDQDRRDALRLDHERRERRFEDKRSAYVGFALACREAERRYDEFLEQHGETPADRRMEGPLHGVLDAFALVTLVGSDSVRAAAEAQSTALHEFVFGDPLREYATGGSRWDRLVATQEAYRDAVQKDLGFDEGGGQPLLARG